jgi:DNA replication protein DnaC
MNDLILITKKMELLRMKGMLTTFSQRLEIAQSERWSYSTFLDTLLSDEIEKRNHSLLSRRLAKSMLNQNKTLETFDFKFNSKIHAGVIRELACCNFIEQAKNIFLIGPTGVGKSHLAEGLGHEACRRGFDVLCYRTHKLFEWINGGHGDGSHGRRMDQVIKIPLLILDDFGLQSMSASQQEDLYEVICERYEKRSFIITSNRDLSEWGGVFANPLIASAAMDRLVHKGIEIVIDGGSFRIDEFKKNTKPKK